MRLHHVRTRNDHEDRSSAASRSPAPIPFRCCATRRRSTSSTATSATRSRRSTKRSPPRRRSSPPICSSRWCSIRCPSASSCRWPRPRCEDAKRHAARANARERGLIAATEQADRRRLASCVAGARPRADRVSARRVHGADRAPDGLLPRRRAEPAQPHLARAARLGRDRARLLVRARHARVRARGDEPVSGGRGDGAQGARDAAARRLGGARGRARHGDAGPHRRGHRVPAVARAGLGAGQRLRVPQLLAPRAVLHGRRAATTARSRSTMRRSIRSRRRTCCRSSTRPRCCGA